MRRFILQRNVDISGISGTGVVAEGVEFSDGTVAVRWPDHGGSTAAWPSIDGVVAVHGHSGATEVRFLDGEE